MSDIGLKYCKRHRVVVLPFMGKMPCCIQEELDIAMAATREAMLVVESAEYKLGVVNESASKAAGAYSLLLEALRKYAVHSPECHPLETPLQESDLPYHTHLGPHRTQEVPARKIKCVCGLNEALGDMNTTPCTTHLIGRCEGCGYSYCINCQTCGKCPNGVCPEAKV